MFFSQHNGKEKVSPLNITDKSSLYNMNKKDYEIVSHWLAKTITL